MTAVLLGAKPCGLPCLAGKWLMNRGGGGRGVAESEVQMSVSGGSHRCAHAATFVLSETNEFPALFDSTLGSCQLSFSQWFCFVFNLH